MQNAHIERLIWETEKVQQGTMQKPRLGDTRCNVNAYGLDNDLTNEVSLGFSFPILGREACFEDDVNCSTNVIFVYLSVDKHANVLLLSMKQHGERGGACSCVR